MFLQIFVKISLKQVVIFVDFRSSYWSSQLFISILRYLFVMYPIEVHNYLPNMNGMQRNRSFFKLLRWKINLCKQQFAPLPFWINFYCTLDMEVWYQWQLSLSNFYGIACLVHKIFFCKTVFSIIQNQRM